jgi:hypothetical protein
MTRLSLQCARRLLSFGLLILFSNTAVLAKNLAQESSDVPISVFNDSGISAELLKQAEGVSSRVFGEAGIQVDWVNCSPGDEAPGGKVACGQAIPQHLHLHIVRRSLNLRDSILGISYLASDGTGFQADIFYDEIEKLRHETLVDPAILLGHVAAHEIGHLLLGTNSHSSGGIMRAHWTMEELTRANNGLLLFTKSQSHRMTEKLCVDMASREWQSASSTEHSAEGKGSQAAALFDSCCRLFLLISDISSGDQ